MLTWLRIAAASGSVPPLVDATPAPVVATGSLATAPIDVSLPIVPVQYVVGLPGGEYHTQALSLPHCHGVLTKSIGSIGSSNQTREPAVMSSSPTYCIFSLLRLDANVRPGVTAATFQKMFTQCRCGLVMTRRAFGDHHCVHTIIDLTMDVDTDEDIVDLTLDSDDEM